MGEAMNTSWLDRNRHTIFIGLLLATLGGVGGFYFGQPSTEPIAIVSAETVPTATPSPLPPPSPTPGQVRVYVTGAVANSDVYILPEGSIIKDAILAAGGFTPDAKPDKINQAQELLDQQQIHVPRIDEDNPPPPVQGGPTNNTDSKNNKIDASVKGTININTATLEELDSLPGIGPVIAQRIIDYRGSIGGFQSIESIMEVSGIGEATFAKIKELIAVE